MFTLNESGRSLKHKKTPTWKILPLKIIIRIRKISGKAQKPLENRKLAIKSGKLTNCGKKVKDKYTVIKPNNK